MLPIAHTDSWSKWFSKVGKRLMPSLITQQQSAAKTASAAQGIVSDTVHAIEIDPTTSTVKAIPTP